jgi:hypothetical protein
MMKMVYSPKPFLTLVILSLVTAAGAVAYAQASKTVYPVSGPNFTSRVTYEFVEQNAMSPAKFVLSLSSESTNEAEVQHLHKLVDQDAEFSFCTKSVVQGSAALLNGPAQPPHVTMSKRETAKFQKVKDFNQRFVQMAAEIARITGAPLGVETFIQAHMGISERTRYGLRYRMRLTAMHPQTHVEVTEEVDPTTFLMCGFVPSKIFDSLDHLEARLH